MVKKGWIITLVLLAAIGIVYHFPMPRPSFEQIYERVDRDTRQSLVNFRNMYPTRQVELDGNVWNYVSMGQGSETILFLHGMMSKSQFLARYRCVIDTFKAADFTQSNIPVLIVEAENDPLVAKELRDLLKTIYPDAPVKSLGPIGHFPYLNAPHQYNRVIKDFFNLG